MTAQAGAVAAGAFDGPGPQHRVVVGELHQLGIALGCGLDGDLAEARNRLQICALLAEVDTVDFAAVQAALGVSDYVVSKHLKILIGAGYVSTHKERVQGRAQTWLTLTDTGRTALQDHLAELRRITGLNG